MNEAINVRGFSKRHEGFELRVSTLRVPCGCVVGLVGANGAGKTTLIKALLGMLPSYDGSVCVFGTELAQASLREVALLRQDVGVALDSCAFPGDFTVDKCARAMRLLYPR